MQSATSLIASARTPTPPDACDLISIMETNTDYIQDLLGLGMEHISAQHTSPREEARACHEMQSLLAQVERALDDTRALTHPSAADMEADKPELPAHHPT